MLMFWEPRGSYVYGVPQSFFEKRRARTMECPRERATLATAVRIVYPWFVI